MTSPAPANLLIVDDDVSVSVTLGAVFERENCRVQIGRSLAEMSALLDKAKFDVALVDMRLGEESGLQALAVLQNRQPDCHSIVLTGYASLESAVGALRLHAVDYLNKPCDLDQLKHAVSLARNLADAARACRECLEKLQDKK